MAYFYNTTAFHSVTSYSLRYILTHRVLISKKLHHVISILRSQGISINKVHGWPCNIPTYKHVNVPQPSPIFSDKTQLGWFPCLRLDNVIHGNAQIEHRHHVEGVHFLGSRYARPAKEPNAKCWCPGVRDSNSNAAFQFTMLYCLATLRDYHSNTIWLS